MTNPKGNLKQSVNVTKEPKGQESLPTDKPIRKDKDAF
jgi:hypothetical protein